MATDVENLKTRRSAIYTELAALTASKAGGKPNTTGEGTGVDHVGYKDGLYRELKMLNELIASAEDAFEVTSEAYT